MKVGELLSGGEQSWFMGKSRIEVDTRVIDCRLSAEHSGKDPATGAKYDSQSQVDVGNSQTELLTCSRHICFLMRRLTISKSSVSTSDVTQRMITYSIMYSSGAKRTLKPS